MYGDAFFLAPGTFALMSHSNGLQGSTTYQYVFAEELPSMLFNAPWYRGSAHATDLFYMFYYEQSKTRNNFTEETDVLVHHFRSYWTNFAKTG
jgi:carboxylesterase type B